MTKIEQAQKRVNKAHEAYLKSVAEFNATVDAEDAKAKAKIAAIEAAAKNRLATIEAAAKAQSIAIEAQAKLDVEAIQQANATIITPAVRQHTRAYIGVGPVPQAA